MTNPIIRIHNAETDEVIDREMTATEFEDYLESQKIVEAEKALVVKIESDKAALLAKLGITADEAKLLLS
jgi:hypothetical protein